MADNDLNNDEYKFAALDETDNESMTDSSAELNPDYSQSTGQTSEKKDIRRNAVIAVGLIVFIMIMYKIIGSMFFTGKSSPVTPKPSIPPLTQTDSQPVQTPVTPVQQVQPVQQTSSDAAIESNQNLQKKVSDIELSQQGIKSDVNTVSNQVNTVNENVTNLNTQITKLDQIISTLSNQVTRQSEEIAQLMARAQPKQVKRIAPVANVRPRVRYFIQAIIPGRAWLIASNGSTLTIREGTRLNGYGVVKLIDSLQGRVLMSSGQVIRFSQEDS